MSVPPAMSPALHSLDTVPVHAHAEQPIGVLHVLDRVPEKHAGLLIGRDAWGHMQASTREHAALFIGGDAWG